MSGPYLVLCCLLLLLATTPPLAEGLNNGIGLTPPMVLRVDRAAADGATLRPRPPPPPSREPCQYWLCEESNAGGYSRLNLTGTGIQTHRTISINGDDFGAGKTMPYANGSLSHVPMTLAAFINDTLFSDAFLQRLVRKRLVPRIFGGTSTTNVLILDLEYPFPWVHPCEYGGLNDTALAAVVAATRRRVRVIRQVLPNAGVALYSTVGCTDPKALTGYSKAAQLGLFNELTYLVPVVYMGAKTLASKVAFNALNDSLALRPTDSSRQLAMLPLFTWLVSRKSGGKFYGCSLSLARLHNEMAAVRQWDASQPQRRVAAMVFWTPGDTGVSGPGHACGRNSPEMNYEEWLRRANIVPHSCPHNVTQRDTLH
eukprot:COSAG01_NODE_1319_length_10746_cov_23.542125_10_plen_370_part_00